MAKEQDKIQAEPGIDEEELNAAQAAAEKEALSETRQTVKLKKKLEYMGKTYTELHFDFDELTGQDSLDVENEIERRTGGTVVVPAINIEYLTCISAKACEEPIGRDALLSLNLADFNHIRNLARNFMLRSDR